MGTKNNPGKSDCYAKAEPDEPMFVLLARDIGAPETIRWWAHREARVGAQPFEKIQEAYDLADAMIEWRKKNR